ncbi:hypothetical protein DESUT3_12760 [Desulfuromonas versatilis]|uniref:YbhB/YbcL family Raf kinase inhibitor-like protein n=2 Tax=Desulfuromonas versatilis TaxID=2802975 RepID=A0ABN6DWN8_9BACT|nr:hypothetical protein DESUT3_12760 [Desulfuromonas versatilis]
MRIDSGVFEQGGIIPAKYTCDGANVSPPLDWSGLPGGAASLALICDDPDAPVGTWVHWVAYNIPVDRPGFGEHIPGERQLADGCLQGHNDFKRIGYGGPCPPSGTHRYFFKLYALDCRLALAAGATKEQLLAAMKGHILGEAELMGTYRRSSR